ncbi:hypothetical protein IZ6_25210 [Terrihabitans soli]|uniref:DUF4043 family protein n=1 Tax=Terrihabitans soli TaxID=708113 RepID=A0A6S6QQG7_9HYPH|nr:hypothetical protein [Terrihabitans soli]BCJ91786.1 hypothetical protein IZ6_25210 [Terrihabitans soli]
MSRPLHQLKRRKVQELAPLRSDSPAASAEAAIKLVAEAKEFGLGLRDFLTLGIDVRGSDNPDQFADSQGLLGGYEAALSFLGLPVNDNFEQGVVLDLASDTFQTFPGTRALFPEVVDDMVRWKYRQDTFENVKSIVGTSRTVAGVELISTVIDDKEADYQGSHAVAELSRVRVKTIRTTQNSVQFFKHGSGYRTSYEFSRRARLDLLTPYAIRMARETERSKVWAATEVLINGDGVHAAAGVVAQSSFNTAVGTNATNGKISYQHLVRWLIARAKAGTPIDTVLGNWDAYIQWLIMFGVPTSDKVATDAEQLANMGFQIRGVPLLQGTINFALSSGVPDNQLVGYSRGDTIEELIEAGSLIEESERSIQNQSITYVKTENSGYRLPFGDTRSIYNFGG